MSKKLTEGSNEQKADRLLHTLEKLLEIEAVQFDSTLQQMAYLVAETFHAEKVDIFLYDEAVSTLVALGTSDTPLGRRERELGLDRHPVVNGGYIVKVFVEGTSYFTEHADQDPNSILGMVSSEGLGIRSEIAVPLNVGSERRGVLMASSRTPEFFSQQDLHFLEAVAHWVGVIIHRTELSEQLTAETVEQSRRLIAEELIAIVAHDLRNYITPLRAHLDLLQMRARRGRRSPDLQDVTMAKEMLKRFERLIENLLDIERLNQDLFVLNPQLLNLTILAQEVVSAFSTSEVEIVLKASDEMLVYADPERLRQLIENLLANAISHAPEETLVTVTVYAERRAEERWAVLTVSNQGASIPPDVLTHLFQPFVKDSRSKGLGLGLYIASRIASAHHGTLTVDSQPGERVQFSLALPINGEYTIEDE
jgi:signal transduction histidine kinase